MNYSYVPTIIDYCHVGHILTRAGIIMDRQFSNLDQSCNLPADAPHSPSLPSSIFAQRRSLRKVISELNTVLLPLFTSLFLFFLMIPSYSYSNGLDKSLVRYESFDNVDDSDKNFSGTVVSGKFGDALSLDGSRDYLDLGDLSIMEDYQFTVSFFTSQIMDEAGLLARGIHPTM